MAKYNPIILSKAQFLADAAAHKLYRGEVYIIEDEQRLAIATSNSTFFMHVNLGDLMEHHGTLPGGALHHSVDSESSGFMTPDILGRLEDVEHVLLEYDWTEAIVYWENIENKPTPAPEDGKQYVMNNGSWEELILLPNQSITWVYTESPTLTVEPFTGVITNTSGNTITITLPEFPKLGDTVYFTDYAGTWEANNLTLDGNGKNIVDLTTTFTADISSNPFGLVFSGVKWVFN